MITLKITTIGLVLGLGLQAGYGMDVTEPKAQKIVHAPETFEREWDEKGHITQCFYTKQITEIYATKNSIPWIIDSTICHSRSFDWPPSPLYQMPEMDHHWNVEITAKHPEVDHDVSINSYTRNFYNRDKKVSAEVSKKDGNGKSLHCDNKFTNFWALKGFSNLTARSDAYTFRTPFYKKNEIDRILVFFNELNQKGFVPDEVEHCLNEEFRKHISNEFKAVCKL